MWFIERDIQRFLSEWRQVQNKSLKVINILLNIVGRLNIVQSETLYKEMSDFPNLNERIVFALYEQIDLRVPQLTEANVEFERVLDGIHKWQEMLVFRIKDKQSRLDKDETYAQKISLLQEVTDDVDIIVEMFEAELKIKEHILETIRQESFDPMKLNFYLTIWVSEPYLEYNVINDKMDRVKYLQKMLLGR